MSNPGREKEAAGIIIAPDPKDTWYTAFRLVESRKDANNPAVISLSDLIRKKACASQKLFALIDGLITEAGCDGICGIRPYGVNISIPIAKRLGIPHAEYLFEQDRLLAPPSFRRVRNCVFFDDLIIDGLGAASGIRRILLDRPDLTVAALVTVIDYEYPVSRRNLQQAYIDAERPDIELPPIAALTTYQTLLKESVLREKTTLENAEDLKARYLDLCRGLMA